MTDAPVASPLPEGSADGGYALRLATLQRLQAAGYAPFGDAFETSGTLADIAALFQRPDYREGLAVRAAGRLMTVRQMGKSIFADLRDGSGRLQVYVGKATLDAPAFEAFKLLDAGDQIGVEGELFVTRTGEPTVRILRWTLLAKALRSLPEKWHGLRDVETRYRQRYLDLIANPEVGALFACRSRIVREVRQFLWARGFIEVETPMMQPQAGGAAARPFQTHYTALAADMYLRIAPELYLKRLLVGGCAKVFELNRNFRNEGLSKRHNPEFTMLELYQAWSDRRGMQALAQDLIATVAENAMGTLTVGPVERPIVLSRREQSLWPERTYHELILEQAGADWYTLTHEAARARATALGIKPDPAWSPLELTHEIYEKLIEPRLYQPTFVTRLPRELVPLAKTCADDPAVVDVFELVIGGMEIAPAYSELNDPLEQRRRLEAQAGAAAEKTDEDFLLALEHGMPPAGGMGLGIDRLVMILTGAESIRDVILFPQLRTRAASMPGAAETTAESAPSTAE